MFAARNQLITLEYNRAGDLFEFPVGPTRVGIWNQPKTGLNYTLRNPLLRFTRGTGSNSIEVDEIRLNL